MTTEDNQKDHYIKQLQLENEELKIRLKWAEERLKLAQQLAEDIKQAGRDSINGIKETFQLSEIDQEIENELTNKRD